jgi:hypothetical protein
MLQAEGEGKRYMTETQYERESIGPLKAYNKKN